MLGPYEEELRRFILGEIPFPANILLVVCASQNRDDHYNRHVSVPYRAGRAEGGHRFMFVVPGLTVIAIVGGVLSEQAKSISTIPAGFIHLSEEHDRVKLSSIVLSTRSVPRRGKLATR